MYECRISFALTCSIPDVVLTFLIRLLFISAMYKDELEASKYTPLGSLREAEVAGPARWGIYSYEHIK